MVSTKNIYSLPFNKKDLIAAISHPRAHFAHFKHAIDFCLPEGTELLAPKAGIVMDIKVDSKEGGMNPKYNDVNYVNYLTLKHSNGEYSKYVHLKYDGVLVKLGERVKTGQFIALSGNTGFTTEPHLHFQVFRLTKKNKFGWESLDVKFKEKIYIDRVNHKIPKEQEETMNECDRVKKMLDSK